MNRKISMISAAVLMASVAVFFVCQVISVFTLSDTLAYISYGVCILLALSYVVMTVGHAQMAGRDRAVAAGAAQAVGLIYAVFICIVYFSQLTVVRQNVLDPAVVNAFAFDYGGSWLFAIDIIGYGMMALSTLFLGLSVETKNKEDKILRTVSLLHGCFTVCMILPMTSMFLGGFEGGAANMGALMLAVWCLIFFPIPLCSWLRFKKAENL